MWIVILTNYYIRIQFCVPTTMGGTGRVWQTEMGFDTGSTALQVFPYEMPQIIPNPAVCRQVTARYPTGAVPARAFRVLLRVVSHSGKVLLPFIEETAVCAGNGDVRLSGLTFQDNRLISLDPANQVLQATTQGRWLALFAALGPAAT